MEKLNVLYFNGEKIKSVVIGPEISKKCPFCGLPLDFHVCRQKEIDDLKAQIKELTTEIYAYQALAGE